MKNENFGKNYYYLIVIELLYITRDIHVPLSHSKYFFSI